MIDEEYPLGASERLRGPLGRRRPACRTALAAAAQAGEREIPVGPVAAAPRDRRTLAVQ
jgi:hypothetical protein